MQKALGSWAEPTRQVAWWRRRVEAKRGVVMVAIVALTAFGAILALDTAGVPVRPAAALVLSAAGGG